MGVSRLNQSFAGARIAVSTPWTVGETQMVYAELTWIVPCERSGSLSETGA